MDRFDRLAIVSGRPLSHGWDWRSAGVGASSIPARARQLCEWTRLVRSAARQFIRRTRDGAASLRCASADAVIGLVAAMVLFTSHPLSPTELSAAPATFTYSYSNLLDGQLALEPGFSEYEVLLAVEEGLSLWAQHVPITFVERPDTGPLVSSQQYSATGHPMIRIGHLDLNGNTLAQAYFPGSGGLAQDVHVDDSNRTWSERSFLTTATHELGHAIGLDHIEGTTAVMNSTVGGANVLPGLGQGYLFAADINAAVAEWGSGRGDVVTERVWQGSADAQWSNHANWDRGWRPTANSRTAIESNAVVQVATSDPIARSLTLGGGTNRVEIAPAGKLTITDRLTLGSAQGGASLLVPDAPLRYVVPRNANVDSVWFAPDFDDTTWEVGAKSLGYDRNGLYNDLIAVDLEAEMYNRSTSVYTRLAFDVPDPSQLKALNLRVQYDDGFLAYLNGELVAADNRPSVPRWNSTAPVSRDDAEARVVQSFDISSHIPQLVPGRNVLAIHTLNNRSTSSDLLLVPQLTAGVIDNQIRVDGGQLEVRENLVLAQDPGSRSEIDLAQGLIHVRGHVLTEQGYSVVNVRGGRLVVDGAPEDNVLLAADSQVRYWIPADSRLDSHWIEREFDDTNWNVGQAALGFDRDAGYQGLIKTDLENAMYTTNSSFYSRIPFQVDNPHNLSELTLEVQYDDGFVAFLNGQQVAADNAPDAVAWNSSAVQSRDDQLARSPATFDLTPFLDQIQTGTNVLAIQGLNRTANSSDLLLVPRLSARRLGGTFAVNELHFYGGRLDNVATIIGQVVHHQGVLSPTRPGSGPPLDEGALGECALGEGALGEGLPTSPSCEKPGTLSIDGRYQMEPQAVLAFHVDGTDEANDYDRLIVRGEALLGGTLRILVNENGGNYTGPGQRGVADRFQLIAADSVQGTFASLEYDRQPLTLGHQGNGLFRSLEVTDTDVVLMNYWAIAGDADGNGQFNSTDLIEVFRAGEYEDSIPNNSDWTEGDWNGDTEFSSDDFIAAFQDGRYETGSVFAVARVPEPTLETAGVFCVAMALAARRRRNVVQ